jgi:transcriptional regulator with PAS, ATPase and Fis domain
MTAGKSAPTSTTPLATHEIAELPAGRASRARAYLLVAHRDSVRTIPLAAGTSVIVGREPPADVAVPDKSLSRRHARFTLVAAEEVAVEDLGSTNGTRIGNKRVERARLRPGEEALLGAIAVSLHVVSGEEARPFGLESHEAFSAALDAEVARARFFARPFAVLMVRALASSERAASWAPRAQKALRPIDRAALYGAEVMEILLPEATRDQALAIARAVVAPPGAGSALSCGVAFFPAASSPEELIEASLEAMRRATAAQPVEAAANEAHRVLTARRDPDELVMESPAMREVARTVAKLATAVIPVLLHGETGTGKEVVTRLVHEGGPRRDKPLVAVNCGAIPAELVESTLFGHERGAFTGAGQQQRGLFEAADGGTILLDEIGELPAPAQAALLRVLEEKRVRRVGATREIEVDVRVVAATHRDLAAMVEAGTFRRDLYYRLAVMEVTLPPLRERRGDIAPLAARFLAKAAKANARDVRAIAPEALALLARHAWPGNVRELRNVIERAVVVADGDTITPQDLPERMRGPGDAAPKAAEPSPSKGPLKTRLERFERDVILEALRETNGNQTEAARRLEVPLRTLQHKISAHGIKRTSDHRPGDPDPADRG